MKNPFEAMGKFYSEAGSSLDDVGASWVAKPFAVVALPVVGIAALFQKPDPKTTRLRASVPAESTTEVTDK